MYLIVNKKTNRILNILDKKPLSYSNTCILAEVKNLPDKYDYLKAENIREVTDTWKEVIEDYDENGEIIAREVEKTRNYFTCDLRACFNPAPTKEQLDSIKLARYETLVERLIRHKYTLSNEIAILRQASVKTAEFEAYNAYAEECKAKAKAEVYGN